MNTWRGVSYTSDFVTIVHFNSKWYYISWWPKNHFWLGITFERIWKELLFTSIPSSFSETIQMLTYNFRIFRYFSLIKPTCKFRFLIRTIFYKYNNLGGTWFTSGKLTGTYRKVLNYIVNIWLKTNTLINSLSN